MLGSIGEESSVSSMGMMFDMLDLLEKNFLFSYWG